MTQRWSYFVLSQTMGLLSSKWDHPDYADLNQQAALDRAGREGWELVSAFVNTMNSQTMIFKKPS